MFEHRLLAALHVVDRLRQGMQSRAVSNPFVQVALSGRLLELSLLCRFYTNFGKVGESVRVVHVRVDSVASGLQVLVLVALLVVVPVRLVLLPVVLARLYVLHLFRRRLSFLYTFVVLLRLCRCRLSSRRGVRSWLHH